ncbi:hypothetical protein Pla110_43950 [Polystyrenella longa]|uniref:Uncharacterized protein n=1 Tax=Polystyrenella longa TaxID=2528007 RepID=A0A518CTW9_9PLAN|nr:hypothetical protein [Polystyrenella longa]QDU82634.1 hypothetical protein Pla110_43950 [Polystyrenella longa]
MTEQIIKYTCRYRMDSGSTKYFEHLLFQVDQFEDHFPEGEEPPELKELKEIILKSPGKLSWWKTRVREGISWVELIPTPLFNRYLRKLRSYSPSRGNLDTMSVKDAGAHSQDASEGRSP